jgi:hypothetical protein
LEKSFGGHTTTTPFLPCPFTNFPTSRASRFLRACYSEGMNSFTESSIPNGLDRVGGPATIDRASKRAAANKANAQDSTGPRTAAGKQRSSLNAYRHGLTGQTIVLPTEDVAAYQRHSQALLDEYLPNGPTEIQLVQSLTDTSWRMHRVAAVETNLFTLGITEMEDRIRANHPEAEAALAMAATFRDNVRAFSNISVYSQRLSRQFERTLNQLRQIQAERRAAEERQLGQAAKILKMHKAAIRPGASAAYNASPYDPAPYNPADDGFVFSTDQIETFLRRQNRREQANSHDFYSCA